MFIKFFLKLILPFIKNFVIEELTKEENKTVVINKLNELIDIPNLSEESEKVIIENIYNSLTELLKFHLDTDK